MNSAVKVLHQFLQFSLSCEERLEPYKLPQQSTDQLFAWLDKRRRGFVDVSDFYEKFKDLCEDELFFVFKTLDASRTGSITLIDLRETIASTSNASSYNTCGEFEKSFKSYVKVLKANYHSI